MEPRNYLANAGATPPEPPAAPSVGYPQPGVPGVNEPTTPGPYWFYKIGESLRRLIVGSGQTPSDVAADSLDMVLNSVKRFAGTNVKVVTAAQSPVTLTAADAGEIVVDASAGNVVLNLPPSSLAALWFRFHRVDSTTNTVTVSAAAGNTIGRGAIESFRVVDCDHIVDTGAGSWMFTAAHRISALVHQTAAQSIPHDTHTTVQFQAAFDPHSIWDAANHQFTVPPGARQARMVHQLGWAVNSVGWRIASIRQNNSASASGTGVVRIGAVSQSEQQSVGLLSVTGGDTLQAYALQSSGGALQTIGTAGGNWFSVELEQW